MFPGRTALVLSAGGLFGAWQAGAWKHLSRVVRPDLIIGASVGALNGWQIATGCPPEELETLWLDERTSRTISRRKDGGLFRGGYFDPAPLLEEIRRIFSGRKLQIPFHLVVVEVPHFRPRVITGEDITPEHLLASCSIYLFYPNVRIDGRQYTDGGLVGHLPLWAAADLGATRIIALDCLPKLDPWWVQGTISALHCLGPRRRLPQDVTVLRPSSPLGTSKNAMAYDRRLIQQWIDLGETDARKAFPDAASN